MPRVSAGHQKRQRERIVVAAEACFAENGFHATSMDDVVNAVGMSTSTVYNYFPGGKNELIVTVCKERTDAVFARIAILAKRENPPSLREVYAEVALAFWRHMEKVERERLRSDEEDAPDEGEQAPEEGGQVLGEGGRASGGEDVADRVVTDEALRIFEELGQTDGAEPPEWMLRSVRLAVNAWAETIRNPGLNRDMRRRHSEFRKALTVLVDGQLFRSDRRFRHHRRIEIRAFDGGARKGAVPARRVKAQFTDAYGRRTACCPRAKGEGRSNPSGTVSLYGAVPARRVKAKT